MKTLISSCLLLVFLQSSCSGAMDPFAPHTHPAQPLYMNERNCVMHYSAHDPCSRWGFWIAIDNEKKTRALNDCKFAYDSFTQLTDEEQISCPNPKEPYCRPGFGCNRLEFKCTFLCETEVEVWRRQGGGAKRLVKVMRTVFTARPLRTIASTVVEPRNIPPGSDPDVYSIGHARERRRTYAPNV